MWMVLKNKKTGEEYGNFGNPVPVFDECIEMCFPGCEIDEETEIIMDGARTGIYTVDLELVQGKTEEQETYKQMKDRHQNEVNALPLKFAFTNERFAEILAAWNITEEDAKAGAVLSIGNGGFIRAADRELVINTFSRIHEEEQAAINNDSTGDGFIYQMFRYELLNHEFGYTQDATETLFALGITYDDLEGNEALKHGFNKAVKSINAD